MGTLRAFFRDHRQLAMLLVALALAVKAMVPAGYMVGTDSKVLTIQICADGSGQHFTKQIVVTMTGKSLGGDGEQGKADGTCPYSALSMTSLGGADPALLALALAFILTLGFAPVRRPWLQGIFHLRPPLRGPPALL